MRPVQASELLDLKSYEAARDRLRADVIAAKQSRRVALGANMSFLFENRDTVRYQVHEMLRIERISEPAAIQHELDTYNELVPRLSELSATLLIEYADPAERDTKLRALLGLEQGQLRLVVGKHAAAVATFDNRQIATDRISSVHYVRFPLTADAARAFRVEGLQGNIRLVCDHPAYPAETVLTPAQVLQLAGDLDAN